jgi:hypothetical protein
MRTLEQLVNGVRKGPWPFRVGLTEFVRSLPAVYQLLSEYACLDAVAASGCRPVSVIDGLDEAGWMPGRSPTT